MLDLDRFRQAQALPHAGYAVALRELQAGAKTSHWIWYAAEPGPQLAMMAAHADAILAAAAAQGYLRCAYTEDQIRRSHA